MRVEIEDQQERNTVLAALRVYQRLGYGDPGKQPDWVHEIASDGFQDVTLDDDAIDSLCERINC